MDWLIWAIGAIILIGFIIGIYRGAVRIAVSILTAVLTIIITFFLTPYVADVVEEKTPLDDSIRTYVAGSMTDAAAGLLPAEEAEVIDSEIPRDIQIKAIETTDYPDVFKDILLENNNDVIYGELGVENFVQYVAVYLTRLLIHIATFLVLFLLVTIVLRALVFALNVVNEIPVFGLVNRLTGGAAGILCSLMIVWFLFVLVTLFYTTEAGKQIYDVIQGNVYTRFIYENNPLLNISIKIQK